MNTARPWLLADIGGSRTRIGILNDRDEIMAIRVLSNDALPDLVSALRSYLEEEEGTQPPIRAGALAVAAPIVGDRVRMVNRGWSFSIQGIKEALGWERIEVINDFAAVSHALPRLEASHRHQIGAGTPQANAALGVIGPGTGLGVSGLIPHRSGWVPLPSEGGHVTLAPMNDAEAAVLGRLRARFGHVSAERAVSGPGLVEIYHSLAALAGDAAPDRTPAEITTGALLGEDRYAAQAVDMFFCFLGTIAGDLALTLAARGGIYLAGGILPQIAQALAGSRFRERFVDKGRYR
ncbi:MAG: glucokinase, partial [Gammaproteobacteria bacterium]